MSADYLFHGYELILLKKLQIDPALCRDLRVLAEKSDSADIDLAILGVCTFINFDIKTHFKNTLTLYFLYLYFLTLYAISDQKNVVRSHPHSFNMGLTVTPIHLTGWAQKS